MTIFKTLIATLLILLSGRTFASEDISAEKLTMDHVLQTYINAVTHGQITGLSDVLENSVKFTTTRGAKIINNSKSEMLTALTRTSNINQNCITEHSVIEQTSTQAVIKVSMKYEDFTRVNVINLAKAGKRWKITNVSTSFN